MNPVTNNTISTDTLKPTPVLPIASNVVDPNVYNSAITNTQADIQGGLQNAQSEVDATRKNAKDQSLAISTLQSLSGGQGAETIKQYDEKGVTGLFNQLTDLNSQATGLKNEAQAIPIQLQNQSANRGVTVGGIAPIQSAQLRENALKALSLGQQYAIASGNYEKAKDYADRAITAKYQQIDADIKAKQTNLATLEKYDLTPAENKLLVLQQAKLKKEEQDNADRRANDKALSDILINASSQGAPSTLVTRAQQAKTPAQAAMILGQYAGDYYKTELLKSQIKTDAAQRANYYANAAKTSKERSLLGGSGSGATISLSNDINAPLVFSEGVNETTKRQFENQYSATKSITQELSKYKDLINTYGNVNVLPRAGKEAISGQKAIITGLVKDAMSLGTLDTGVLILVEQMVGGTGASNAFINKKVTIDKIDNLSRTFNSQLQNKADTIGVQISKQTLNNGADTPVPTEPNIWQKMQGVTQPIQGSSIINKTNPDGTFNFVIPTSN